MTQRKNEFVLILAVAACMSLTVLFSCGKQTSDVISIKTNVTNDYLIPCKGGYLLIDTGYEQYFDTFIQSLEKRGIQPREIKYLLLTHHHDDHSGFAQRLLEKTGAKLIVHKMAYPFLVDGKPELKMKPLNWCTNAAFIIFSKLMKERKDHSFPPVHKNGGEIIVTDDDENILKSIGVDGMILYTPGHSDDSISVLMSNGSAFVGDLAMDFVNICQCKRRPIWAKDMKQVYGSWDRLLKRGVKTIYSAHGNPFESGELIKTMNENKI